MTVSGHVFSRFREARASETKFPFGIAALQDAKDGGEISSPFFALFHLRALSIQYLKITYVFDSVNSAHNLIPRFDHEPCFAFVDLLSDRYRARARIARALGGRSPCGLCLRGFDPCLRRRRTTCGAVPNDRRLGPRMDSQARPRIRARRAFARSKAVCRSRRFHWKTDFGRLSR